VTEVGVRIQGTDERAGEIWEALRPAVSVCNKQSTKSTHGSSFYIAIPSPPEDGAVA
jgi:hypothetical protein